MPATTSLFIDKWHPRSNGKCAISVRVTFERKKKYFPTGITLTTADFEKACGKKPRAEFKQIGLQLHSFEKKAADIIKDLPVFTFKKFEKKYFENRGTKQDVDSAFLDYVSELKESDRIGTAVSYDCARISIKKFAPGIKFADVTPDFLRKYESWMLNKQGNSITTVGIYLRSLRTLFNNAIADGLLSQDYYPFGKKRYEIPTGNNKKKALNLKDIGSIFNYKADPESIIDRARDYWIFMYLCNGINVKDMSLLKYENIKGEVIEFVRAKTARTKRKVEPIRITLTDDVKRILNKWGNKRVDDNTYIFPILEKTCDAARERQLIQQMTHLINDKMNGIAKDLKIESNLTTYVARHSFATVLQRSGVSTEFISESLGHSNLKTTKNYLAGFEDEKRKENIKALTDF
ncbi:MAG: phage integrase SAM-like domain-containing protein [Ginsengibacter sp.]